MRSSHTALLLDVGTSRASTPSRTKPSSSQSARLAPTRVCLVGGGVIAAAHAEALQKLPQVVCTALVEPHEGRARKFCARWGISSLYPDLSTALAAGDVDAVHILTPPDKHASLARACIDAGVPVLIEKPLATSLADAEDLARAALARGVVAAVNQNFVFHPAFKRLHAEIANGGAGPLRDLHVTYAMPLRQLAARQFGAWMFHAPVNILLEQAVHPLSQILALLGPVDVVTAAPAQARMLGPDQPFYDSVHVLLRTDGCTAHLQFAVGRSFPSWTVTAVCDDAILVADIVNNRFFRQRRGPGAEPIDALAQALRTAGEIVGGGVANVLSYGLSLLRLKPRSDPFFRSMQQSLAAFYGRVRGLSTDEPTSLAFGADVVRLCHAIADQAFAPPSPKPAPASPSAERANADVLVIGGTGFIGATTCDRLAVAGYRVRAMARNVAHLPAVFQQANVTVVRGDISTPADIAAAISGVPVVVNLAHGGGGESVAEIELAMAEGARNVAEACLDHGVRRLIHVGSIAGLYCGNARDVITGTTSPDSQAQVRAAYAQVKAKTDRMLMAMHRNQGLPLCILRPGIVVGEGTSPFHSGLGAFNNEQHCIGWNDGRNPLPFVLVEDVAAAILAAIERPDVIGKAYNLVGGVRLDARTYIAALAAYTGRPLHYHPSHVGALFFADLTKWLIKRAAGRPGLVPSLRDLRSRGLVARFDCTDAARDLGWRPVTDRETFIARAFAGS